jgi:DNA-binding response OmpR family regulator
MPKVLVLDPNRHLRILYAHELGDEGYEVVLAGDEAEALEKLHLSHPDIVVMDVARGGSKRADALKILSQKDKPPIIINTAFDWSADEIRLLGPDAWVIKSSDLSELKEKIRLLLSRAEQFHMKEIGTC